MQKETFEFKIRRKLDAFDRQAPPETWEKIQQGLRAETSTPRLWPRSRTLLAAGIFSLLIGIQFINWLNSGDQDSDWAYDNYWEALALAKQEDKPMLVLFSKDSPSGTIYDDILQQGKIKALRTPFIQVRLALDDQTPIDSALAYQFLPDSHKAIEFNAETNNYTIQIEHSDLKLEHRGQVWEYLQRSRCYQDQQPFLAIFDKSGEAYPFPHSRFVGASKAEIQEAISAFLELHQAMLEEGYYQASLLFKNLCSTCHNSNMKDPMSGPALGGVTARWSDYPKEDLYAFIRNSQQMIADEHPKALEQWVEWRSTPMLPFPNLTDQELGQLLNFVEWRFQQN